MKKASKIIFGLGNHVLINTRHSIGMRLCNRIAEKYNTDWDYVRKYKSYVATVSLNDEQILLVKSKLPMNLNGKSVKRVLVGMGVALSDVIVVHDDLDRSFRKLSWKLEGSASGHNGVKSVISSVSSDKFKRMRIGIGRPKNRDNVITFVLEEFTEDENLELDGVMENCIQMLLNEIESYR